MENKISKNKNFLLVLGEEQTSSELEHLKENFCGRVVENLAQIDASMVHNVYVCGDISRLEKSSFPMAIIEELSFNNEHKELEVKLGEVPILVSGVGVYFRELFKDDDYFNKIQTEHQFQQLSESNKNAKAFRTGIYLSDIKKEIDSKGQEKLHFHLLRCSSNLTGATDNFRETDRYIVGLLNRLADAIFEKKTQLNHVLVQIYHNRKKENNKELKAKLKAHSDKTKDMPKEGVMAFCTFYDDANLEKLNPSQNDRYDRSYKERSGFTRLHFELKKSVNDSSLEKEFTVILYPNSAFFIPLSTNRLYTHEVKPSRLNIDKIPTRMGYVARCSNLEALYMNGQTYVKENDELVKLEEMTQEGMEELKRSYVEENEEGSEIKYGKVNFSMNLGDYEKPIY